MNSGGQWVEMNLQKQRLLLEERQRQRRLQHSGIVSSHGHRSDSLEKEANGVEQRANSASLYSFLEQPVISQQSTRRSANSANGPKVITVKGITPPHSRRQSVSSEDEDEVVRATSLSNSRSNLARKPPAVKSAVSVDRLHAAGRRSLEDQKTPEVAPSTDEALETNVLEENERMNLNEIITNLDKFVMEPCRKNVTMKCRITRDKKGMDKGMFPIYYLHLEKDDDKRVFLLAARRRKKSATANYLISTDPTDLSRNAKSFTAKVRSNAVGTMFTIYDNGENPKKAAIVGDGIRQELGAVIYETNVFGFKGPRKMTIIVPGLFETAGRKELRPISEKDTILERFRAHRMEEMIVLNNKQPVWNEDTQSYVLNFHGRVTQASVKNFQLVHHLNQDYIVMQFGRIDNATFTMDFRYPLSPVQAFGVAMSSFHGKLACE